jgi:hypothetical protein
MADTFERTRMKILLLATAVLTTGGLPASSGRLQAESLSPEAVWRPYHAEMGSDLLLHVRRTGGILGVDESWWLNADGLLSGPDGGSTRVAPPQLARLLEAMAALPAVDEPFPAIFAPPCFDCFVYTVTWKQDGRTLRMTTSEIPASQEAAELLRELKGLFMRE